MQAIGSTQNSALKHPRGWGGGGIFQSMRGLNFGEQSSFTRLMLPFLLQAIRTVELKGLQAVAKDNGVDLTKFPYNDMRPQRREWLAAREEVNPPMNKNWMGNSRRMKNPEKLAASKKQPMVARYLAGRVVLLRKEVPLES